MGKEFFKYSAISFKLKDISLTVEPEYNDHPWDGTPLPPKEVIVQKVVVGHRSVPTFCSHISWVGDSGWSLLTGGRLHRFNCIINMKNYS
jgi:hypothetical protein